MWSLVADNVIYGFAWQWLFLIIAFGKTLTDRTINPE